MIMTRVFGLFAAVFAIAYTIAFEWHWELFSYHPREGAFGWGQQPSKAGGPVMHWYGAIGTAFVAATLASLAALPFAKRFALPVWLGWAVPLACMFAWLWMLRIFFTR